jgi:hypothetical protein
MEVMNVAHCHLHRRWIDLPRSSCLPIGDCSESVSMYAHNNHRVLTEPTYVHNVYPAVPLPSKANMFASKAAVWLL